MFKVLLMSHGNLCTGMLDTIKIFAADVDHVQAIPFYCEGIDAEQLLSDYSEEIQPQDVVLIFTDILWGSVNQKVVAALSDRQNVHIVTGLNLPLVLELISSNPQDLTPEIISEKVLHCRESLVYMRDYSIDFNEADE